MINKLLIKIKRFWLRKPFVQAPPNDYISPQQIIKRYSVEELNQKAENYFQHISEPTPFLARPFSNFNKSPDSLTALGALLSGLQLGKSMKVLEIGAGVCWLSRLLNQMGAVTVSVDCSKSAIETAKQYFKDYPIIGDYLQEPQFLVYDGHHLELDDQSIDRIICFDAFHHIPNLEEVLTELHRVLKDGGIAGYAEPGLFHSYNAQSQSEMRNYGVLENDLHLDQLKAVAEKIGFTDLFVQLATNTQISFSEYQQMLKGKINRRIKNEVLNENANKTIFFLHKGELVPDSRNGHGLHSTIQLQTPLENTSLSASSNLEIHLTIKNTGQAKWLCENIQDLGVVKIGAHLLDSNKNIIEHDYLRIPFDQDILPEETLNQTISVPLPSNPGNYILAFDLLAEHICWFENCGSLPLFFEFSVN